MRRVAAGATEFTTGFILRCLDNIRSNLQEDFRLCTGEVQDVRQSAAEFGLPGPVQQLMGQIKGLWERDGMCQCRITALVDEKEQARVQCDQMAAAQANAQREIGQLKSTNDQLQKDNERLWQELQQEPRAHQDCHLPHLYPARIRGSPIGNSPEARRGQQPD